MRRAQRLAGPCVLVATLLACQRAGAPVQFNTGVTPATHAMFPIASGVHAASCNTCHGDFQSFKQVTCLNCHAHDQPITDQLHRSLVTVPGGTRSDGGMGYAYRSASCLQCHAAGARVPFDHAGITSTCASCHDVAAPFVALPVAGVGLDGGVFMHPDKGGNDCRACHTTTSWFGTSGAPDAVRDPSTDVVLAALIPTYSGTSIASVSARTEALPMPMNHRATGLSAAALSSCANCHAGANAGVFFPGKMHASLTFLKLAQPTLCLDCHLTSVPAGFVGPTATNPARTPASGEMKHDAVHWVNGRPTATGVVPAECALCHQAPSVIAQRWTTTSPFHSSLSAASQAQPGSCVDCHANSRPQALLTAANAAMPANVQFDHAAGAAMGECASCHGSGSAAQLTSWTKGKFHLAASTAPSSCLPCHSGERPTATAGWTSTGYQSSPFDYVPGPASAITHGDGQDCAVCHSGPGTGAWGGSQNWVGGHFTHGPATISGTTCIACHATQRPDGATSVLPRQFDHSINGTGDCFGCHQATVAAATYVNYFNPGTQVLPNGDWKGGAEYPASTLVGSPSQFITIAETSLNRSAPNQLVTGTSSISATLYNAMLHISPALPLALSAGPETSPDSTKCWHCHTTDATGKVTSFAEGRYHKKLDTFSATFGGKVAPIPQPTSRCSDCHAQMRPVGIVAKAPPSDLQPMDHDAQFTAAVLIDKAFVTRVSQIDCSTCHQAAGATWTDGVFHARVSPAVPQDCTVCHYSLMADAPNADLTSGTAYSMRHKSGQITFQNCQTCHAAALTRGANNPIVPALWQPGAYHGSLATQPSACLDCHSVSQPAANVSTQSSWVYNLAAGGTSTNQPQWMNHGSAALPGKDCAACHAADARASGSAWSKSDEFHAAVASPISCKECHGLDNGGGSVAGTNNNLPSGLTDSSTTTSAVADTTTGVPPGTRDQIAHQDVNVSGHDCNFCHTQAGRSTVPGVQAREWAQAGFHASFAAVSPLVLDGTTGRCSNCHMNVKPTAAFAAFDHSPFTPTSGTQDCASCHSWPGTGTASSPNWLGAAAAPQYIPVGGFPIPQPPAAAALTQPGIGNLPHPTLGAGTACTTCHATASGGKGAVGYDHASALINSNCASCHEAGSNLVGTQWNNTTIEAAGAGDTRPFTLTSINVTYKANSDAVSYPNHFFDSGTAGSPRYVDCNECHVVPAGNGAVTTGAAYLQIGSGGLSSTGAWAFPHTVAKMADPTTCAMCHGNNIPR